MGNPTTGRFIAPQPKTFESQENCTRHDLALKADPNGSEAEVLPAAEGEVTVGMPGKVEGLRIRERVRIPLGRAHDQGNHLSLVKHPEEQRSLCE